MSNSQVAGFSRTKREYLVCLMLSIRTLQQRIETGLVEMVVGRERISNFQFVHYGKADAIGEGPLLVRVTSEQPCSPVKPLRTNPFQAQCLTAFDGVKKVRGRGGIDRAIMTVNVLPQFGTGLIAFNSDLAPATESFSLYHPATNHREVGRRRQRRSGRDAHDLVDSLS